MFQSFVKTAALCGLLVATLLAGNSRACDRVYRAAPTQVKVASTVYYHPPVVEAKAVKVAAMYEESVPAVRIEVPTLPSGGTITVFGKYLGSSAGEAVVHHGSLSIQCKVVEWRNDRVILTLPEIELSEPVGAQLRLILPTGQLAKTVPFRFENGPSVVVNNLGREFSAAVESRGAIGQR